MHTTQRHIVRVEDYEPLVGAETIERIRAKAQPLRDAQIVHINSTYYGGGVATLLSSLTLLMNSLDIRTSWYVIQGASEFFTSPRRCTTPCRATRSI